MAELINRTVLTGLLLAVALVGSATAATPVAPANGETTSSTPTFRWQLAASEESYAVEISPNPAPGESGRFADDVDRRLEFLDSAQASFTVGTADPLFAGTWYWHVETQDRDFDSHYTPTLALEVPDEPPTLSTVEIDYLACLGEVQLSFEHSDNSRTNYVRWRLDFLRHRNSGRAGRVTGSTTDEFGTSEDFAPPSKLRLGRKYWARLQITDAAGHQVRSSPQRLDLGRC